MISPSGWFGVGVHFSSLGSAGILPALPASVHFSRPCGSAAQRRNEKKFVLGRAQPSQTLPGAGAFRGGQNIRANAASTALGRPSARLWSPLSRARERGDQSRALGRPNAVEAALARMFCPPLKAPAPGRVWEGCALPRTNFFSLRRCAAEPHGRLK